jgi:hypothetical protein
VLVKIVGLFPELLGFFKAYATFGVAAAFGAFTFIEFEVHFPSWYNSYTILLELIQGGGSEHPAYVSAVPPFCAAYGFWGLKSKPALVLLGNRGAGHNELGFLCPRWNESRGNNKALKAS